MILDQYENPFYHVVTVEDAEREEDGEKIPGYALVNRQTTIREFSHRALPQTLIVLSQFTEILDEHEEPAGIEIPDNVQPIDVGPH